MIKQKILEEIGAKISDTLAHSPAADIEKNLKALLASAFTRLDLVTREEFDVQQQVLVKTRAQLAALEARVVQLESKLAPTSPAETSAAEAEV